VVGVCSGIATGQTFSSFTVVAQSVSSGGGLAVATLATAFAYEGWIVATTINAELRDAKKTLPRALFFGSITVVIIYMLYYLGISGVLSNEEVIKAGNNAPVEVISMVFGRLGGILLTVFVIISCLGTLNGLIMGSSRGMYSIASRGLGPNAKFFSAINHSYNSTVNSAILGFVLSVFWLVVWYGNFAGWFGAFMDISELPIAFLYVIYLSLYLWVMRTFTDLGPLGRFVVPFLAGTGSLYIIWGAIHKDMFFHFLILTLAIVAAGIPFMREKKNF
jgi:basic amino acid/polyamine antiporter, APA family